MKISIVQTDVVYKDKAQNITQVSTLLANANAVGEIVLLPELFSTGYIFETPEDIHMLCEEFVDSATIESLRILAERHETIVVAGIAEKENDKFYNSVAVIDKSGLIYKYRKISQTNIDKQYFTRGDHLLTFKSQGVVFGIAICFDLWFPEIIRGYAAAGVDVLLHPANFGGEQSLHIAKARAIENNMYVATCNRVGKDVTNAFTGEYCGSSQICSPTGEALVPLSLVPFVNTVDINLSNTPSKRVIGVDLGLEIKSINRQIDRKDFDFKINTF